MTKHRAVPLERSSWPKLVLVFILTLMYDQPSTVILSRDGKLPSNVLTAEGTCWANSVFVLIFLESSA